MRQTYTLTDTEVARKRRLPPEPKEAFLFWWDVAAARQIDPKTIMGNWDGTFTALPLGHKKHWCYPMPLKCRYRPQ